MNYETLDRIIKERGTTRRKLAIKAGINPATLQSAFQNNSQTGIVNAPQTIQRFAQILGVSIDEILSDAERDAITSGRINGHRYAWALYDMHGVDFGDEISRLRQLDKEILLTDGVLRLLKAYFGMDDNQRHHLIEDAESRWERSLSDKEEMADRFNKRNQNDPGQEE